MENIMYHIFSKFQANVLKIHANKILHIFSADIQAYVTSKLGFKHQTMKAFGKVEL
jgi:hypothetical protein